MKPEKYKICKTCGNRNHPRSGQCPWCGARLNRPMDWIARICLLLIVLVLLGLLIYSRMIRTPTVPTHTDLPISLEASAP